MNLYPIKIKGKYGLIDSRGHLLIEPKDYTLIGQFVHGRAVALKEGRWFLITEDATVALPKEVKYVSDSEFDLYLAKDKDYICGYLGADGQWKMECQFAQAMSFHSGLAVVKEDRSSLYKVINGIGQEVFSAEWNYISDFTKQGAVGRKNDEWYYLGITGEVKCVGSCDYMGPPSEGVMSCLTTIRGMARWHFLNLDLDPVMGGKNFSKVTRFGCGICGVKDKGGFRLVDMNGNPIHDRSYTDTGVFHNGLCPARSAGERRKWGAVNMAGEWVIDPIYDGCDHLPVDGLCNSAFVGDLIMVWTGNYILDDGKIGYYDYQGRLIWEPRK